MHSAAQARWPRYCSRNIGSALGSLALAFDSHGRLVVDIVDVARAVVRVEIVASVATAVGARVAGAEQSAGCIVENVWTSEAVGVVGAADVAQPDAAGTGRVADAIDAAAAAGGNGRPAVAAATVAVGSVRAVAPAAVGMDQLVAVDRSPGQWCVSSTADHCTAFAATAMHGSFDGLAAASASVERWPESPYYKRIPLA